MASEVRIAGRARRAARETLAVALGAVLVACSEPSPPPRVARTAGPRSVVLVTIDTLRRDHLGLYGHGRETSPNLDAFARGALVFDRAVATSGTTLPSHLSILTGLYPHQHGMESNASAVGAGFRSSPGRRTVAEVLGAAGYRTAAFVSGAPLHASTGVSAGFETFEHVGREHRLGADTTDLVLEWLGGLEGDRPVFLWVHYWDPHEPNLPAEGFEGAFGGDEVVERMIADRRIDPGGIDRRAGDFYRRRLLFPELQPGEPLPATAMGDVESMLDRYDADVLYTDRELGRLFAGLDEAGLLDDAVVAVTADHGQSLGEHDWLDHGRLTYENVLAPLVVRFPDELAVPPGRVDALVSLVDLMPTVLARLGGVDASALLEQAAGFDVLGGTGPREYAFCVRSDRARDTWEPGRRYAVVGERWKLIHGTESAPELYDLAADPREQVNVATSHPRVVAALQERVLGILADRPAGPIPTDRGAAEGSADLLEALKELGYAGDE